MEQEPRERERERREQTRRRWLVRWQVAAIVAWSTIITSTVVFAGVCSLPSTVEVREPSIERAIELAEAGDPLGALMEYQRLDENGTWISATDLLRFSQSLLDVAEQSEDPTLAAISAESTASRAFKIAKQDGDASSVEEAGRLRDRARSIHGSP